MRDPPGSRDVRHRIARLFPEYGGWSLLRLFGQQQYRPWCSSSLHLHRRRLRPRLRPRRLLRPHLQHHLRLRQCAPCADMVFTEPFEFFVAFFELRRRVLWFIRPCARSSGVTSSLRPAPPRRHRRRPLLPLRLLQQLRAASASSSSPFFCACDRRGGLLCWSLRQRRLGGALSLARPVLATPVRAIVPDAFTGLANPGMCRSMACLRRLRHRLSSTASMRRRLRLRRRLRYASTMALPSAPAASCAAPYHRRPRQLTIDHGYPTHDFLNHGYLLQFGFFDIGTKGYHPYEFLAGSLQSQYP